MFKLETKQILKNNNISGLICVSVRSLNWTSYLIYRIRNSNTFWGWICKKIKNNRVPSKTTWARLYKERRILSSE